MIRLTKNTVQKFVCTLNELADINEQMVRWLFTFELIQSQGNNSYKVDVILTDLMSGQNNVYNEFEIDSAIFDKVGGYKYKVFQLDATDTPLKEVERGLMQIQPTENDNKTHVVTSKTIIYGE